jgi:DnaJ-class molecular chaperone
MDPFVTLGLKPNASLDEIRATYKRLAREHHPDKGGTVERFQAIQKAYEHVCNRFTKSRFNTIFDNVVNIVPRRQTRIEIKLTLEELFTGKRLIIHGVQIELPAGITPFETIIIPELPNTILMVTVAKHPYFTLDFMSKNLIFKTSISLCEALVGYRGKIKHPNGKMMYLTTPENQIVGHEMVFKAKGAGVPSSEDGTSSDLVVIFSVIMPKTIDSVKHRTALMEVFDCNVPIITKKDDDFVVELNI